MPKRPHVVADIGQNIVGESAMVRRVPTSDGTSGKAASLRAARSRLREPACDAAVTFPSPSSILPISAAAAGGHRGLCLPRRADETAAEKLISATIERPRSFYSAPTICPKAGRTRFGGSVQRQGRVEDAASAGPGKEHGPGQDARDARRPAARRGSQGQNVRHEQARRRDSVARS